MKRYGSELIFISWILRDGSGTEPMTKTTIEPNLSELFTLNCLSITEGTYIASGFNTFIVKLKNPPK